MKSMVKNVLKSKYLFLGIFSMLMMVSTDPAYAAQGIFSSVVNNPVFKTVIDIAAFFWAGKSLFDYVTGFKPDSALRDALMPAFSIFVAFQWVDILRWVGLI